MRKLAFLVIAGAVSVRAAAQPAPEGLTIAMYAPAAAFPDSSARLAYIQGLAKAVQQKTGVPTSGKIFVRLGDLTAAKPDFAVIDGQCLATHSPGQILATAVVGGETAQPWALYTRGGETLATLRGKKLAYVKTSCRDTDFLDNAMLDGEVKTGAFFGTVVDKPDVSGAVLTVRDYQAADAVFAPAAAARGLTKIYDAGPVPNPGFVAMRPVPPAVLEGVREAVLAYGGGGGFDGWRAAASYQSLAARMGSRAKRPVFAAPDVVHLDDQDVLVVPASKYEQASVKQHFWAPETLVGAE
jgi:hypothetical protein